MVNLDIAELRSKIDQENKYVDFSILRTALSVQKIVVDLGVSLSAPNKEGECRGKCPKCEKDRSFALNVNTNRFNCFNKTCVLKGGGVIDFFAKLYQVPAKEASHLIACAYGIQPYTADSGGNRQTKPDVKSDKQKKPAISAKTENENGSVSRLEFEKLQADFDRFKNVVYAYIIENDPTGLETEARQFPQATDQIQ